MLPEICPKCPNKLVLKQINFEEAILFCDNLDCDYPVYESDCYIISRSLSEIKIPETCKKKRKKNKHSAPANSDNQATVSCMTTDSSVKLPDNNKNEQSGSQGAGSADWVQELDEYLKNVSRMDVDIVDSELGQFNCQNNFSSEIDDFLKNLLQ